MSGFEGTGRILVGVGVFLVLFGLLLIFGQKLPFLGRLPGDITVQQGNTSFFFPLGTSLIISLMLTVIFNIIFRFFK